MTDMSQYETVLIAALTSAAVALAIEWAAKPRLEARKDRILELSKAKRAMELHLSIIVGLSGSLMTDVSHLDSDEQEVVLNLLEDYRTKVIESCQTVEHSLAVAYRKIDPAVRDIILMAIGSIRGITLAAEVGVSDTGVGLANASGRALDIYRTHRWQTRKRRKLAAAANSYFDSIGSECP
jgi:hypothetical protein